jgi:hypothetical protein
MDHLVSSGTLNIQAHIIKAIISASVSFGGFLESSQLSSKAILDFLP